VSPHVGRLLHAARRQPVAARVDAHPVDGALAQHYCAGKALWSDVYLLMQSRISTSQSPLGSMRTYQIGHLLWVTMQRRNRKHLLLEVDTSSIGWAPSNGAPGQHDCAGKSSRTGFFCSE